MVLSLLVSRIALSSRRSTSTSTNAMALAHEIGRNGGGEEEEEEDVPEYDGPPAHDEAELPPSYPLSFSDALAEWRKAAVAGIDFFDIQKEYEASKAELEKMRENLKRLKEQSVECYARLHEKGKPKMTDVFKGKPTKRKKSSSEICQDPTILPVSRSSSGQDPLTGVESYSLPSESKLQNSHEGLQTAFEASHAAEMLQTTKTKESETRLEAMKKRVDTTSALASGEDEAWMRLKYIADSSQTTPIVASRIGEAMEALNASETAFELIEKEKSDLTRARLTVQHAHRYFTQALKICDDLHGGPPPEPVRQSTNANPANVQVRRGMGKLDLSVKLPRTGNGFFGRFGATMKVLDYQKAVRLAGMAQACLNECIRVLERYAEAIPEGQVKGDFEALKKDGVLQLAQVYNLIFGGRIINSGVEQVITTMLRQQEAAFASLTRLAVWVQRRVPECEAAGRDGGRRRFEARQLLAEEWRASATREEC